MSSPRILCDVDGVLFDFVGHALRKANLKQSPLDIFTYKVESCLSPEDAHTFEQVIHSSGFCRGIPPYAGALAFAFALERMGDVTYVTAPLITSSSWLPERDLAIDNHLGRSASRIFASGKDRAFIRADVIIDDCEENVMAWLDQNPDGLGLTFPRPWNAAQLDGVDYNEVLDLVWSYLYGTERPPVWAFSEESSGAV